MKEHSERLKDNISSGEVDDTKAVGLLDQWLIEGKFTEEEALSQSYDMLAAGIDTVRQRWTVFLLCFFVLFCFYKRQQICLLFCSLS